MTGTGDPRVAYCTEEDVRDATDITPSASTSRRLARIIYGASANIEGLLNRRFYPQDDTRYFDWPLNYQYAVPWRLWLDNHEVLSVDTIVTGNRTLLPGTHFILRPENTGPPYSSIEILVSSDGMWSPGSGTWQQAIQVNGRFGGNDDTEPAGTLAAAIADATTTSITVTDSAAVGALDTIRAGTEWMTVTRKSMTTTGQTITGTVAASKGANTIPVSGGTWSEWETILAGAERMRIIDVAGGTLIVKRAIDGTTLAAHAPGDVVYAPRALTVTRGILGSTAASHSSGAAVSRLAAPELVRNLAVALSVVGVQQDSAGWMTSRGAEARVTDARAVDALTDQAYTRWARQSRMRAV